MVHNAEMEKNTVLEQQVLSTICQLKVYYRSLTFYMYNHHDLMSEAAFKKCYKVSALSFAVPHLLPDTTKITMLLSAF